MHDKLADFGLVNITTTAGSFYAGADGATANATEVDMGADRNLGLSNAEPTLVVESDTDEGTTSKYTITLQHSDASCAGASKTPLLTLGPITTPKKGVIAEIPIPKQHRRFLGVKVVTTGNPNEAKILKAYIVNGGHAGQVTAVMPD